MMGLDSYVKVNEMVSVEVVYWRNCEKIHKWFFEKALGLGLATSLEDFNCDVPINQAMFDELVKDIKEGSFGYSEEEMHDGLEKLLLIQDELAQGKTPYYVAWW